MKVIFIILLLTSSTSFGQAIVSIGGFKSIPLANFSNESYSEGLGLELGIGYQLKLKDSISLELNVHWQFGANGNKTITLPFGDYTINNNFTDWHIEGKLIKRYKYFQPYIGAHFGCGNYSTTDSLKYDIYTSEVETYLNQNLPEKSVFQAGLSIGTYFKISKSILFDVSLSSNFGINRINFISLNTMESLNNDVYYENKTAFPALLLVNFGLTFKLNGNYNSSQYTGGQSTVPKRKTTPKPPKNPHFK